jgi:hypothetical protein
LSADDDTAEIELASGARVSTEAVFPEPDAEVEAAVAEDPEGAKSKTSSRPRRDKQEMRM